MGNAPKDWDITSSATPDEIKKIFPRTFDTGIQHGTVTVLVNNNNYEVTTFRIDGKYTDKRRPSGVSFTKDLEEDLSRRDFTINAIAYNPDTGITDPFNGIADIRKKTVRCVGCAGKRFSEDALRMIRAIRFSSQLSFEIETATYKAIAETAENISFVSIERIRDEFTKILCSKNPAAVLLLKKTGLWVYIMGGRKYEGDISQIITWLEKCPKEIPLIYALFLSEEKDPQAFMKYFKFDNKTINETCIYVSQLRNELLISRYAVKSVLSRVRYDYFNKLISLKKIISPRHENKLELIKLLADDIIKSGECISLKTLDADGRDLGEAGIPAGKTMGFILHMLLDMVMKEPLLNNKSKLIETGLKLYNLHKNH